MRYSSLLNIRLVRPASRAITSPKVRLPKALSKRKFSESLYRVEDAEMGKDKDKDKISYQLKVPKGTKDCKMPFGVFTPLTRTDEWYRGGQGYGHP